MAIGTSQAFRAQNLRLLGNFYDKTNSIGNVGYRLNSTGDGTKWLADTNESSGILTGGVLSATIGGTTFNVSAGTGQIVTNSLVSGEVVATYAKVSWSAQNNVALTYRTSHQFSYIYIDENGALQQQNSSFTDAEYRNKIVLGVICHINQSTINLVTNRQNIAYGDSHRIYELASSFGPIKRSGLAISAYSTNLRITRAAGAVFSIGCNYASDQFDADSPSISAANPASLCRVYQNGSGGFIFDVNSGSYYTDIDPTKYDNSSGTLQTVNNNQWSIQRLYFFPSNQNDVIAYYGRAIYNSYGDAVGALSTETFSEATITAENAVFLGYLVVRGGATNLSTSADAVFFQSGAFRNIGAGGAGGGGGGASPTTLDDLSDVTIASPSNGQFLVYDSGTSLWKNLSLSATSPITFTVAGTTLTLSVNNNAINFNKIQQIATSRVLGRISSGTGDIEQLTGANIATIIGANEVQNAAAAITSVNLAGGIAGAVVYQAGANTTGFTALGTAGQVLLSGAANAPTWANQDTLIVASAAKLTTKKTLWGQDFDGSANVTGNLTSVGNITGSSAITITAGGSNQNIAITPSGTGYTLLNGNVGIGTTTPTELLHLSSIGTAKLKISADTDNVDENDIGGIELSQDGGITTSYLGFDNTNNLILGINSTTSPNIYLCTRSDGTTFTTNADSKVTILNNGNVGISATTPNNKLTVIGAANIGSASYNTAAPANGLIVEGNVGIGTTSPSQKLEVRGNVKLGADNSGSYIYYVKDNEGTIIRTTRSDISQEGLLRSDGWGNFTFNKSIAVGYSLGSGPLTGDIYASGSVGIGTTAPSTKLQVVGTVTAASFTGAGTGLTGTASGLSIGGSAGKLAATVKIWGKDFDGSADINGDIVDASGKTLISFPGLTSVNRVNYIGITIADATVAPIISAEGTDTNINLDLRAKGTGSILLNQKAITLANSFTTVGNFALTLTTTGQTNVTLPTTGTLATTSNKLSAFANTSSAELASVITDETGTGLLVFATSPTFKTSLVTDTASFDLFNTTATTINAFGAATSLTIGATTGTTTIRNDLRITGDLTVNGTTTTVNSTVVTIDDPILTLGGDTSLVEVTKDRGIEFKWNGTALSITNYIGNGTTTVTGTVASTAGFAAGDIITISGADSQSEQNKLNGTWKIASVPNATTFTFVITSSLANGTYTAGIGLTNKSKNGFFGLDQSSGRFTFIPQANNTSEVFSGSLGDIEVNNGYFSDIYLYDDSTPSHYLQITNSANLTQARTLSINVNDASRTISLSGNLTLAGSFITAGANSLTLTTTAETNVTLPTSGTLATTTQSFYIGTTEIAINRASASQTLGGVSIDGNAATVTNGVYTSGDQSIGGVKTFTGNYLSITGTNSNSIDQSAGSIVNGLRLDAGEGFSIYGNQSFFGANLDAIIFQMEDGNNPTGGNTDGGFVFRGYSPTGSTPSASNWMVIRSGTLVGIGTTNPTNTLDVNGTVRIRTTSALGSPATVYLTRDSNGVIVSRAVAEVRSDIGAGTGNGTVTSVAGTGNVNGITLTGTVTDSGNLTLGGTLTVSGSNFASQTANTFFAAPNGSAGNPSFRAIVAADIPTLNQDTTGTAAIATNTTITDDVGTNASMYLTWVTAASGNRPQKVSSTKLTFNPSSGTLAAGVFSGSGASLTNLPTGQLSGTVAVANGGTGANSFTAGRVLFGNGTSAINTSANLFWDNSNTRLGIGTAAPTASLDVVTATASSTVFSARGTSGTLLSVIDDLSDSLLSVNNSAGLPVLEVFADDRVVMGQYGQNDLVVRNNKVGIGTVNPGVKLDVNGDTRLLAGSSLRLLTAAGLERGTFQATDTTGGGGAGLVIQTSSGEEIVFKDSSDVNMVIKGNGNVGIGATTLYNKLVVIGAASIGSASYNTTAPTNGLIIEGDVGIGTTAPSTKLQVVGTVTASSFTGAGTGLTGTASGLSIGGSAATLTTTRKIWGQNFNGSADVNGDILDTANKTLISFPGIPTANRVNYIGITIADATVAPIISAEGNDTNINLDLRAKGTGSILLNQKAITLANSFTTAGNFALTLTTTGQTNVTLPTTGTLATTTQSFFIGTTQVAINRASASQTLGGVSIDGNAATVTNGVYTSGSYADPTWISSLAGSKVTGNIGGNAANVTGVVGVTNGGTGITSYAVGDLLYASAAGTLSKLAAVAAGNVLLSAGVTTAPSWGKVELDLHVSKILPVANGGTGASTFTAGRILFGNGTSAINTSANLFWDNSNSRLGIGTATPSTQFQLEGGSANGIVSALTSFFGDGLFKVGTINGTSTNSSGEIIGKIGSYYNFGNLNSFIRFHRGGGATDGYMSFSTNSDVERVRIDASGNVGIGTTNPSNTLDVNGTTRIRTISASGSAGTIFLTTDANGVIVSRTATQVRSDISAGTGSGTVTSIVAGSGLSGGTITSSGTIAVDSTVVRTTGDQSLAGNKAFDDYIIQRAVYRKCGQTALGAGVSSWYKIAQFTYKTVGYHYDVCHGVVTYYYGNDNTNKNSARLTFHIYPRQNNSLATGAPYVSWDYEVNTTQAFKATIPFRIVKTSDTLNGQKIYEIQISPINNADYSGFAWEFNHTYSDSSVGEWAIYATAQTVGTDIADANVSRVGFKYFPDQVSINSFSPKAKLQSSGAAVTPSPTLGASTGSGFYLTNTDTAYGLLCGVSGTGDPWLQAQRTDGTATAYNILLNPSGGNVGAGTVSPRNQLSVIGAAQNTSNITDSGNTGGTILIGSSTNAYGQGGTLLFATINDGSTYTPQWGIKSMFVNGTNNGIGDLVFSSRNAGTDTALTERIRLKYSGEVGIGTSNPATALQIGQLTPTSATAGLQFGDDTGTRIYRSASNTLTMGGTFIATTFSGSGASLTNLPAGQLSGTIPSAVLGNSTVYIGTTAILLNRASASQTLNGVNISGSAGSLSSMNVSQFTNDSKYHYHRTDVSSLASSATLAQPLSTFDYNNATNGPTNAWYNYFSSTHNDYLTSLIANRHRSADWYVAYREGTAGTPTNPSWYLLLHTGNYNTYAPTLTGTGASGNWAINVTGSAATVTSRTLWGQTYDGSANVSGNLTSVGNITGSSAITITAGGSNQNVTITPSGTGYTLLNGNVGIGTATPAAALHSAKAAATTTPTGGSAAGVGLYVSNVDPLYGMMFGVSGGGNGWIQQQRSDATNTQYHLSLQPIGGNVGIGTTAPAVLLHIGGSSQTTAAYGLRFGLDTSANLYRSASATVRTDGSLTVGGTVTELSALKYKENISPLSNILNKLCYVQPVTYNKKGEDKKEYGVIAEEIAELFPELVSYNNDEELESVNYSRLTVLLIQAVKELKSEIDKLKKK